MIRDLDTNYHKQETVKCLVNLSRKIGALVVAEGLETAGEALMALELGSDLTRAIERHHSVECFYVLDSQGSQITETVWTPRTRRHRSGMLFYPAPRGADHSAKEYFYLLMDVALTTYATDPYISSASGHLSRTISSLFHHSASGQSLVLCIDVLAD